MFRKGRYVYHYCAHYQESIGTMTYRSGIAQASKRITSKEHLDQLKKMIEPEKFENVTIAALSYLGREFD